MKDDGVRALKHCDPIYLLPNRKGIQPGRSSESATVTYVKFKARHFALTCAHVAEAREGGSAAGEVLIPTVFGSTGRGFAFRDGSNATLAGRFRVTKPVDGKSRRLDIAIAPLSDEFVQDHLGMKGKVALDLDSWFEPDWSSMTTLATWGFPNRAKSSSKQVFAAELQCSTLVLASSINESRKGFTMFATLKKAAGRSLSGMSGSATFCHLSDGGVLPVGLMYEGAPGEPARPGTNPAEPQQSFLSRSHFQIFAYVLTPNKFATWLKVLGLATEPPSEPWDDASADLECA